MVAGGHPLSVEAGLRILQNGGNAVDAGVATILAASVIEFSHFSFGGEVPILIKLKGRDVSVVEGMGQAPMKATREFFVNRAKKMDAEASSNGSRGQVDMAVMAGRRSGLIPSTGPLSATVPAVLDACVTALDQFGTKTLAEVMQPAIELADGFPIDELRVQYIKTRSADLLTVARRKTRLSAERTKYPKSATCSCKLIWPGRLREIVRAERLASKGTRNQSSCRSDGRSRLFLQGPIAKRIGDYMQANGGLIAASDFAALQSRKWANPFKRIIVDMQVYKAGFWTQGPALVETLNLLEGFDLKKMGHNSSTYIHTLAEALKLALADRDRYYGDPNFVKIPMTELLSKYVCDPSTSFDRSHNEHRWPNIRAIH